MAVRSSPRRLILASVLLLTGALTAGCGAASTSEPARSPSAAATGHGATVASFRNDYLVFRYPVRWKPFQFRVSGTLHFHPMVYVSTQPSSNPCRQSPMGTECGWPVDRLRPNGVLIVWENRGYPGWSLASVPGRALRVGGRSARSTIARPGACSAIGADETVQVAIERPLPENWTAFTACLRGPHLSVAEREIDALLASTRFLAP
jgi:hypothetical protein